jgi:peptidoglycan/LPS O-acetylase OafA/YrhL
MFLFLVISIVMNGIQIYFNNTIIASINTKSIWYNDFCSYAHVSLGISIFLVLYILLGYINFGKFKIILSLSDQYSYEIYLVHQIFILGPFCLEKFTSYIVINIILICIVILALSALLKKISAPIKKRIIKQL